MRCRPPSLLFTARCRAEDTDWRQIVRLYDLLARVQPTPVIALNRAAAVSMADAPAADGELENYHLLHASRAHPRRRLGLSAEAAQSYRKALALVTNESQRRFLDRRLKDVFKLKAES